MNILIVDDDPNIRKMLAVALKVAGFECRQASDAYIANQLIAERVPDLILIDWMMPHISGVEWIRQQRKQSATANLPIIMLSAKQQEANVISGLDAGADDYITKPFSPRELIARIRSLVRRSQSKALSARQLDGAPAIAFDAITNTATIYGNKIKLGPSEYKLLQGFVKNCERPLTRKQLAKFVTIADSGLDERSLDVYIKRLRQALKIHRLDGMIVTVRGYGYQLVAAHHHQ